jgi:hypothetical protein
MEGPAFENHHHTLSLSVMICSRNPYREIAYVF